MTVMRKNRAATEQRLITAARSLIEESGFAHFGINAVAERAGVDKVLVYRYFGGPNGMLAVIAENPLFPTGEELAELIPQAGQNGSHDGVALDFYFDWVMHRPLLRQLFAWENAANPNPLITAFRKSRRVFEQTLADHGKGTANTVDSTTIGLAISGRISRSLAKTAEQLPITYELERKTVQAARVPRKSAPVNVPKEVRSPPPPPEPELEPEPEPEYISENSLPSELL